jgi:hypothetical protein
MVLIVIAKTKKMKRRSDPGHASIKNYRSRTADGKNFRKAGSGSDLTLSDMTS